ncbi:MFS transporter [Crossiella sp. CA-258035]|uniref:MFS transporter n=1 Tax=Crossiella sp. CA-258035 TaxID=2981138 RepID=UPI0024BC1696|nr:MFS transporter [Crossiella sp. CA-258035]WHT15635.1 MFS transporter [Crossiella sp. CA-258035]
MPVTPFHRLLGTTALSDSATGVVVVAGTLIAESATGSPLAVAAVSTAGSLPWLLFAVPAGVLVDATDRRRLLRLAQLGRGLVLLVAGLLLSAGLSPVPVLVVSVFLAVCLQLLADTAAEVTVPELVPPEKLTGANGAMSVATRLSQQALGPAVAGLAASLAIGLPALAAGIACLAAALLLRGIPLPSAPARRSGTGLRGGLAPVLRQPILLVLFAVSGTAMAAYAAFLIVFLGHARGPLGLSATGYGLLLGASGVGAAVGSLLSGRGERLCGRARLLRLTRVGWAVFFAAPLVLSGWALGVVMTVASVLGGMWQAVAMSVRQRTAPRAELGRVGGAFRMINYGSTPIGAALGGLLGVLAPPAAVFAGCAVLMLVTILPLRRWVSAERLAAAEERARAE